MIDRFEHGGVGGQWKARDEDGVGQQGQVVGGVTGSGVIDGVGCVLGAGGEEGESGTGPVRHGTARCGFRVWEG